MSSGGSGTVRSDVPWDYPVVRFTTPAGDEVEAESRCHQRDPHEGDRVEIFYNPTEPEDLCVAEGVDLGRLSVLAWIGFSAAGLVILCGLAASIGLFVWGGWAVLWNGGYWSDDNMRQRWRHDAMRREPVTR